MHFLAVTAWANLSMAQRKCLPTCFCLLPGFAVTIFVFGILGTIIGFFMSDLLGQRFYVSLFCHTDLHFVDDHQCSQKVNRLAVVLGGGLSPVVFEYRRMGGISR